MLIINKRKLLIYTKTTPSIKTLIEYLKKQFSNLLDIEIINTKKYNKQADLLIYNCNDINQLIEFYNIKAILMANKDIVDTKFLLKIKKLGYIDYIFATSNKNYYTTIKTKLERYLFC